MIKSASISATASTALVIAFAMAATYVPPAAAQTAQDLKCDGCVNSKDIKNNAIRRNDIRNNAIVGSKVQNGSLTGADIMNEAGADFALGPVDFQPMSSTDTIYASVTITAPKPGVVIANATAFVNISAATARLRCSISTGSVIDDSHRFAARLNGVPMTFGAGQTLSASRGFQVAAGSTTFNLVCEQFAGSGTANIGAPHMTAMYFPTQY